MSFGPTPGGSRTLLDISAAAVVKAAPGNIVTIGISGTASAGSLTVNDCATTGAAATANQIISIPFGSISSAVVNMNWFPCATGIVISAVPTGVTLSVAYQ